MADTDNATTGTAPAPAIIGPEPSPISSEERRAKLEKDLSRIPLFMTQLPDAGDGEENAAVAALQTLVSDEPPEQMARLLKDEGNVCFKRGRFADAATAYTNALTYEIDEIGESDLRVSLLLNRAAANLALQNHGLVLRDCADALRIRPHSPKALYRAARACVALDKFDEADECCRWGLGLDPENKDLKAVQTQAVDARAAHEARVRRREERDRVRVEARDKLRRAVAIRTGLTFDVSRTADDDDDCSARSRTNPAAWETEDGRQVSLDESTGRLLWPVVFVYPEAKQSDLVERFDETRTLREMLRDEVLAHPPPWDSPSRPKYSVDNIDAFFIHRPVGGLDRDERLVRIGLDTCLASALDNEKYVIRDGVPVFIVLPRNDPFSASFIDRYRKLRLEQDAARKVVPSSKR
ncbi:HSP70/90 co-chaperone [Coemansia sp. RSA 1939]|nr:HSP70/90 co-chaperone [Coemansia sp. RSA 1939]KAJ2615875.1 HSP70/90 co-chaperone [Coemansia sp. RSA 1804]KAJ2673423.1 HSP70/90 co-chaperone [Coemansia sp. RSA 1285]